jgi:ribosomal protein L12E/L44/L45/RPP1/RPP2
MKKKEGKKEAEQAEEEVGEEAEEGWGIALFLIGSYQLFCVGR